jgi:tetratricopeptide (TPR) repeat protein
VLQDPESKVAIANVGALNCYPPILKLAIELDPKNVVPLVNLASCAMSAEKWDAAKAALDQALALDPNHRPALIAMGQWYLHLADLQSAIPYFVKANGLTGQKVLDELKDGKGNPQPPSKPIEPPPDNRFGGGPTPPEDEGGTARITKNKLELPPLPKWGSPDAFILSGDSRKKLAAFYSEKMGAGLQLAVEVLKDNPLKKMNAEMDRIRSLSPEEQNAAMVEMSLKPKWDDGAISRGLSLNYAWASEKLREADDEFAKATQAYKKIGEQLGQIAETRNKKLQADCPENMGAEQLKACFERTRANVVSSCKQSMVLNAKFFTTYRDAYARWYDQVKPVLEELYRVQGLWIRQISDPMLWNVSVKVRDQYVFQPLAVRMMEEDTMRLALAAVGMSAFGRSAELCPKEPPQDVEKPEEPNVPDLGPPEQKCPLPKNGLKIPPFDVPGLKVPFSFTVWCKEAEFKLSTGLGKAASAVLSVKHRFGTDKTTTVYLGVEAGLSKTTRGLDVGVKGEVGVSVTFKNGQVLDVGGKAGVSESISLPDGVARGSMGVTATIEKGAPNVNFKSSAGTKIPGL